MTIKYLNQQNVKALLKTDPGVKTISAEAVQWIDDVVEQVAKNLAASGRKSPSGRLMGPNMDPGLMARATVNKLTENPGQDVDSCEDPGWTDFNDWQQEVRQGKSKLPFEEWKNEKKT